MTRLRDPVDAVVKGRRFRVTVPLEERRERERERANERKGVETRTR